tara:strand:- start:360 stop:584 length:225 start_codon:yes stop_codon:yes gene_type:complete
MKTKDYILLVGISITLAIGILIIVVREPKTPIEIDEIMYASIFFSIMCMSIGLLLVLSLKFFLWIFKTFIKMTD